MTTDMKRKTPVNDKTEQGSGKINTDRATIWFKDPSADEVNKGYRGSLMEHLGIEIIEVGPDYLTGKMPVDHRTIQSFGLLHGGASVALAETLGSNAANLCVDRSKYNCVGIEINANHLRSEKSGFVTGTARPIYLGKTTHVWEIRIYNENQQLVCISRHTVGVRKRT